MLRSLLLAALTGALFAPSAYAQLPANGTWPECNNPLQGFAEYAFGIVLPEETEYHFRIRAIDSTDDVRLDTLISAYGDGTDDCLTILRLRDRSSSDGDGLVEGGLVFDISSLTAAKRHLTYVFQELPDADTTSIPLYTRTFTQNGCRNGSPRDSEWSFYCGQLGAARIGAAEPPPSLEDAGDNLFYYDGDGLHIVPRILDDGFGPGKTYKGLHDLFAVTGDADRWMLPHARRLMCETLAADGFTCSPETYTKYSFFLATSSGDPDVPGQIHTPRLRDWTLTSGVTQQYSCLSACSGGIDIPWTWALTGQTVFAPPGASVRTAEGLRFDLVDMELTALDPAQGWHGIRTAGASDTLMMDGAALTGVSYDDGNTYKKPNSALTVGAGSHVTIRNGSEISGAQMAQGIEAVGATVLIEGAGTFVQDNDYAGVVAMPNATITIRDQAEVRRNTGGGLVASGQNAIIKLDHAQINLNEDIGVSAIGGGLVETISAGVPGGLQTLIDQNDGGLSASDAGSIQMGTCKAGQCDNAGHAITNNDPAANATDSVFDAQSLASSLLRAQGNDWAVGEAACLDLISDASSTLLIEPLIVNGPSCPGIGGFLRTGTPPSTASKSGGVLLAVLDAEDALADGDAATAGSLLVSALAAPASSDERRGVYGGVRRVLAQAQPAALTADLAARLIGPDRPEALYALTVAALASGDAAAAGHATTLASEYAGTAHETAALGLLTRIAAGDADETAALGHLEALWTLAPDSDLFMQSAAVTMAAFPDVDLDWTGIVFKGGVEARTGDAAPAASLSVWPNPTARSARLAVPTTAGATLDVSIFDGLGRRVATVADGVEASGERFETALPTDGLAPGVYLVRAVSHGADGVTAVSVVRLTVTR